MRLSFVCHEFPPIGGGAATALDALTHALAECGHDVSILTVGLDCDSCGTVLMPDGCQVTRLRAARRTLLAPSMVELLRSCLVLRKHMYAWLAENPPDVVIAYFAVPAGYLALRPARLLGKPLVVSLRGSDLPGFSKKRLGIFAALQSPLLRKVWRGTDLLCANGDMLYQLAYAFMATDKLQNIPNGVDVEKFTPAERAVASTDGRFLFVGQLIARKQCRQILEGMALAAGICGPLELTFAGDGPLRQQLEQEASTLTSALRVHFVGLQPRESLPDLYREHGLLIQVSQAEGASNVVLEALASGLPIIGSRAALSGGAADGETACPGVLLDVVTPQTICDAVVQIQHDSVRRRELAEESRNYAEKHSWKQKAQDFEKLIQDVFRGRL